MALFLVLIGTLPWALYFLLRIFRRYKYAHKLVEDINIVYLFAIFTFTVPFILRLGRDAN